MTNKLDFDVHNIFHIWVANPVKAILLEVIWQHPSNWWEMLYHSLVHKNISFIGA